MRFTKFLLASALTATALVGAAPAFAGDGGSSDEPSAAQFEQTRAPADPGGEPSEGPADPGDVPEEPSEGPADPGDVPEEPSEGLADPGDVPEEPSEAPGEELPEANPAQPQPQ